MQAAAIRDAAEREAAQLRAVVATLSAGSGGFAPPDAANADGGGMAAKAAAPPLRPAAKPVARGKANARGRQARVMRKVVAAYAVLALIGGTSGGGGGQAARPQFLPVPERGHGRGQSR